jgi:hypothetical protein
LIIDFPFSDHCFVLALCKFYSLKPEVKQAYKRNLKPDIVEKIVEHIKSIKFDFLDSIVDAENKYFLFKRLLFNGINLFAPLKLVKIKKRYKNLPWFVWKSSSVFDKQLYDNVKTNYHKRLREKKILYFIDKTPKDFTNSKNFWELYQADIKVKSDKSSNKSPESVFVNNALLTDTFEITNAFNSHFSSFSPDISIDDTDCRHFIFKSFQNMNKVSNISSSFDFTEINRDEVLDLLKDLESNTSPGVSGIPVIILKQAKISIVDPLVQIFNSCITQNIFLREWKTAIVTPLYKSKGDTCDLNNYRGISVLPRLGK